VPVSGPMRRPMRWPTSIARPDPLQSALSAEPGQVAGLGAFAYRQSKGPRFHGVPAYPCTAGRVGVPD
jgi:hypothetical protein